MLKIEKSEKFYVLKNENKEFIKFYEDKAEILNTSDSINENEFTDLIKVSPLKDLDIFCTVSEEEERKIVFLNNLGFEFYGVSFNPDTNQTEEIYKYKYKETLYIKDNELNEILKKLEGGNL